MLRAVRKQATLVTPRKAAARRSVEISAQGRLGTAHLRRVVRKSSYENRKIYLVRGCFNWDSCMIVRHVLNRSHPQSVLGLKIERDLRRLRGLLIAS